MHSAISGIPRVAVFPKCYMEELCVRHSLSLLQWIEMAAKLPIKGLELYPGFFASFDDDYLNEVYAAMQRHSLLMPMLCASPDFTQSSSAARRTEVEQQKRMIDLVAFFDAPAARTCRVLSGQRRLSHLAWQLWLAGYRVEYRVIRTQLQQATTRISHWMQWFAGFKKAVYQHDSEQTLDQIERYARGPLHSQLLRRIRKRIGREHFSTFLSRLLELAMEDIRIIGVEYGNNKYRPSTATQPTNKR